MGGNCHRLPRKGILMLVKYTRSGVVETREMAELREPVAEFAPRIEECRQRFRQEPMTPQSMLAFENELRKAADEVLREVLEQELNRLEPDDKQQMPVKVRYHKETYRINKKTPTQVATRFGTITLRSFLYLNQEDGEPGLHPLHVRLGIGAGAATPALLERVARMSVDHTQAEVRAWLLREHGLKWSNDRLRAALRGFRAALMRHVPELQKKRLLMWLEQAQRSRGRFRPVLAAGRDGIMT